MRRACWDLGGFCLFSAFLIFGNFAAGKPNLGYEVPSSLYAPVSTVSHFHAPPIFSNFPSWSYTYHYFLVPINNCTDSSPPVNVKSRDDLPPGTLVYDPANPGVYFTPEQAFTESFIPDSPPEVSLDPEEKLPAGWGTAGKDETEDEGKKPKILSRLLRTPNITAPLNGHLSIGKDPDDKFLLGLRARKNPPEKIVMILDDQWSLTLDLFKELLKVKKGEGVGLNGSQPDDLRMVLQLDSFSWDEPDTSELTVLDSVFNFGMPATRIKFGDPKGQLLKKWEGLEEEEPEDLPISGDDQSLLQELDAVREEAEKKENLFSAPFKMYQFFFRPPGECPQDIDPGQEIDTIKPQSVSAGRKAKGGGANNEGGGGKGERPESGGKGKKKANNRK